MKKQKLFLQIDYRLFAFIVIILIMSCSLKENIISPPKNEPIFVHPNITFTHALFKTNYSGSYTPNLQAVLEIGQHRLSLKDGYLIETSLLDSDLFVFNIIYTNNILTKGIKQITFTNGHWDGVGNYQYLEIFNAQKGTLHNIIFSLIEDPSAYYLWRENITIDGTHLYLLGTNIARKNP